MKKLTTQQQQILHQMNELGISHSQIAKELEISRTTVIKYCHSTCSIQPVPVPVEGDCCFNCNYNTLPSILCAVLMNEKYIFLCPTCRAEMVASQTALQTL